MDLDVSGPIEKRLKADAERGLAILPYALHAGPPVRPKQVPAVTLRLNYFGAATRAPLRTAERSMTSTAVATDSMTNDEFSGPNTPPVNQSGPT